MAIAFDANSESTNQGASSVFSLSHTVTGSNTLLSAAILSSDPVSASATYNSVSMNAVNSVLGAGTEVVYLFQLVNPTTGTNNITFTATGNHSYIFGYGSSYTGVKQSGQPDASNTVRVTNASSPLNMNITTVADNSWLVGFERSNNAASAGTQCVFHGGNSTSLMWDSGVPVTPAGSTTSTITWAGTNTAASSAFMSIAPVASGTTFTIQPMAIFTAG